MFAHHPDVKFSNLLGLLYINTFGELFWANLEDPWQDSGAAEQYDVPMKDRYSEVFDKYNKRGATFGFRSEGKVYNLPWNIASLKVPVESQGFGPNQIVLGYLLNAGEKEPSLWEEYFPNIGLTIADAIRIALDPDLSAFGMALIYDYYLAETKKTICSDPSVKSPDNVYPTIPNNGDSREFFLLNLIGFFDAWAETAGNFPDYFAWAHHSWNLDNRGEYLMLIQKILELENGFPSLQMGFISNAGMTKYDYLGPTTDLSRESSLLLVLTPKR